MSTFKSTSAYREAMNILIEACYLSQYVDEYKIKPLNKRISDELEF